VRLGELLQVLLPLVQHPGGGRIVRQTTEDRYRGTSLIRNSPPPGPYSSICLGPYGVPSGGGGFL